MTYYAGIDAGSTYVKVVVLDENRQLCGTKTLATGIDARETARDALELICTQQGISSETLQHITATGYSRRQIDIAANTVTEIKAHASGARLNSPEGTDIGTIIDIGGQDSKAILLHPDGTVANFIMNDKCAAGTGRFLETIARIMEVPVTQVGPMALEADNPCQINSMCVVFAESEVISLLARRSKPADVVAGIHNAMAKRVASMVRNAGIQRDILLTGGGGLNAGLHAALEDELFCDIHIAKHPQLNGALGAALLAGNL